MAEGKNKTEIFNRATGLEVDDPVAEADARREGQEDEVERKLKAMDHAAMLRGDLTYWRIVPEHINNSRNRDKDDDEWLYIELLLARFDQWYRDVTAQLDARLAQIESRLGYLDEVESLASRNELDLQNDNHRTKIAMAGLNEEELEADPADAITRRRQELVNQRTELETIRAELESDIEDVENISDVEAIMAEYDERTQLTFAAHDKQDRPAAGQEADNSYVEHINAVPTDPENDLNALFPRQGR